MPWKSEEREKLINYIEILSGTRFHAVFSLINKLRYDISLFFIDSFIYWLLYYIRKLKEIHNTLSINGLWRTRLYEIGIINRDFCLYFGITGLISRSAKLILDARFTGHEFHEELNYSISYPFEVYSSCYFNNSIISLWFCNVMSFCSLISQWLIV